MSPPHTATGPRFTAAVFVVHRDGTVARVTPEGGGVFYQACIHPQGREAVCFGGASGRPRLWRVDLRTRTMGPLTPADSGARHPVYDREGERIAFASDRVSPVAGEYIETLNPATRQVDPRVRLNLFVAAADGSGVTQITRGPYHDHRPTFSPDGQTIVFASNRGGDTGLWRVDAAGDGPPTPVFTDHWAYRPWFAADGRSVFFYGPDGNRHRIYRLFPGDKTGAIPLPQDDSGMTHGPFVSPEGTLLVHSTRGGDWGLWEMPTGRESAPRCITPAGLDRASHPTRARNGAMTCDVVRLL